MLTFLGHTVVFHQEPQHRIWVIQYGFTENEFCWRISWLENGHGLQILHDIEAAVLRIKGLSNFIIWIEGNLVDQHGNLAWSGHFLKFFRLIFNKTNDEDFNSKETKI